MSDTLKDIGRDAKLKAKHLLRIDDTKKEVENDDDDIMDKIQQNAGFNPVQSLNAESSTLKQARDQLPEKLRQLPHKILHPKDTAKQKTASTLATSEEPYLSRDDDERLVSAHNRLVQAEAASGLEDENVANVGDLQKIVDDLEENRQQKKVAWTSSRYIHRARVVRLGQDAFPVRSICRWTDSKGELQGQNWSQWVNQMKLLVYSLTAEPNVGAAEEPVWNRDILLQHVERIVMASSPLQKWLMQIRKLQRWENPTRTAAWLFVWSIAWYWNRVFSFVYCLAIYSIVQRRMGHENRDALQHSHDRAGDGDETAQTFGEMISRHGSSNWTDSMMDAVLPVLQPYVKDWADWMEVSMNFWECEDTTATNWMLSLLVLTLAFVTFANTDVCLRGLTLSTILGFFLHQPLSSRFPRYVQVLVPYHWIFWNVPTQAEASFKYLWIEAEGIRNIIPRLKSKSSAGNTVLHTSSNNGEPTLATTTSMTPLTASDIFVAECKWNSLSGSVVLTSDEMRFIQKFPKKELWKRPFQDLTELKKGNGQTSILKTTQNFLELTFKDGTSETLEHLVNKDELFNILLAFSGLTWHQLAA
jgi:hypothetical protein